MTGCEAYVGYYFVKPHMSATGDNILPDPNEDGSSQTSMLRAVQPSAYKHKRDDYDEAEANSEAHRTRKTIGKKVDG